MMEVKLYELLSRAKVNVKYYSDILAGVNEIFDGIDVLETLPIISKDEIRKNIVDHIDKNIGADIVKEILDYDKDFKDEYRFESPIGKLQVEYTSGTTGIPFFSIKTDKERFNLGRALWNQRKQFAKLNPAGMCCFMHSVDKQNLNFLNSLTIKEQLNYLAKQKYESWHIYPGKLEEYYEFLIHENKCFEGVEYIECNGAYVSEVEREEYQKTFNCKLLNNYGSREVWNIAYSTFGEFFNVNERSVYLEIVDEQNNIITNYDEIGYIVVTSLSLHTMPFIRYKIGDMGCFIKDKDGNKGITVIPGRNKIIGTDLYGNRIFKEVILFLNQIYKITSYNGIYIYQKKELLFEVYINGFTGNFKSLEEAFIKCFYIVSKLEKNYKFEFFYNQKEGKSLFCIKGE